MRVFAALLVTIAATWSVAFTAAGKVKNPSGHDCGKVTTGGFGGPLPTGVPKNARPEEHAFILRGHVSCAIAKSVIQTFDRGSTTGPTSPPGWKCAFKRSAHRNVCTRGSVALGDGIEYKVPKTH